MNEIDEDGIISFWKKSGLVGLTKLKLLLKENNYKFKGTEVDKIIKDQKTYQLHKTYKKNRKKLGHIIAFAENENWQIDLADMSAYSHKNNGFKYILLAVDVYTRKAYAEPLKNKSEESVNIAFKDMIKDYNPMILTSDNGSEFINKNFKKTLETKEIIQNLNNPGQHEALGIIDRFTRTLKGMIHKYFTEYNTVKWVNKLKDFIDIYNNTPHRGLNNIKPNESSEKKEELLKLNIEKINHMINIKFKLNEGDKVRLKEQSKTFEKGYTPKWSSEIYTVKRINITKATIVDKNGKESQHRLNDLQKVNDNVMENIKLSEKPTELQTVTEQNKAIREFNKEGLNKDDIIPDRISTRNVNNKRNRKQVEKYQA